VAELVAEGRFSYLMASVKYLRGRPYTVQRIEEDATRATRVADNGSNSARHAGHRLAARPRATDDVAGRHTPGGLMRTWFVDCFVACRIVVARCLRAERASTGAVKGLERRGDSWRHRHGAQRRHRVCSCTA
jgi:hypothetical protein